MSAATTTGTYRLSDLVGSTLTTGAGTEIGPIVDLEVAYHPHQPETLRWVVRRDRRPVSFAGVVRSIDRRAVVVDRAATTDPAGDPAAPGQGSLLLVQDVLDCQVYDLAGGRLARVSDIHLRLDHGALTVVAVDIGVGSICRRLGLRRIAAHLGEDVVLWPDLHLLSEAGHVAQLATTSAAVHHLGTADLAQLLVPLPPARSADILAALPVDQAAEVLAIVDHADAARLIDTLPEPAAERVIAELAPAPASRLRRARRPGPHRQRRLLRHRPPLLRRARRTGRSPGDHP